MFSIKAFPKVAFLQWIMCFIWRNYSTMHLISFYALASDKLRFVISIKQLFSLALARSQHSLCSAIACTLCTINVPLLQITTQLCILLRYKSKQRLSYLINKIEYFQTICCLLNCSRSSQSGMTLAFNTTTNQIVNASTSSSVAAATAAAATAASTIIMIDTC